MIYRREIRPDALAEIESAADWYEAQQVGLGLEFARAMFRAIDDLALNPLIHRLRNTRGNLRWFIPQRFPYRIVYRVHRDRIMVIAVLHCARGNTRV